MSVQQLLKAVLLRKRDNLILASEYLRTNGDPINASIECYKSLQNQINVPIKIIGLGVTGSADTFQVFML